ncbi:MAG: hypothetical protein MRY83_02335 [Flavobacteriales bacterium]|nr:hypothetical protein [Flavobacteriales bacterium]
MNFLSELLENPSSISEDDLQRIEEMKTNYPYCNSFHVLNILGSYLSEDGQFQNKLRSSALCIQDRKNVFFLTIGSKVNGYNHLFQDLSESKTHIPNIQEESHSTDSITDPSPQNDLAKLEKQYVSNALALQFAQEFQNTNSNSKVEQKDQDKEHSRRTFNEWLNMLNETSQETSQSDAIEKFIQNSQEKSSPTKQRKDFYSAEKMSKNSNMENEGFITETLAKLYIKQGYISKAIHAYEVLLLKNPEKKAYFASQIENLKKNKS